MNADDYLAIRRNFKERLPAILAGEEEGEGVCFTDDGSMRVWDRPPTNGNYIPTPGRPELTALSIVKVVAESAGVEVEEMLGPRKNKSLARPRHIAAVLLTEARPDMTLPQIAQILRYGDHTTILYAIKRVPERRNESGWLAVENHARKKLGLRQVSPRTYPRSA